MSKKIKKLIESLLGSISGNSSNSSRSKRNPEGKLIPIRVSSENKNRPF